MRKLTLVAALLALLPRPAAAATCMSFVPPPAVGSSVTLVLEFEAVGAFLSVVGEAVLPPGDVCPSFPLRGSAHLRPDGKRHFGLGVQMVSAVDPGCLAIWMDGTLAPPDFNTGTALFRMVGAGATTSHAITAAACPPLPQRARTGKE